MIRQSLIKVGYWRPVQPEHPLVGLVWLLTGLPDPRKCVDVEWDPRERELVIRHLQAGKRVEAWFGDSQCRICGISNGSCDLSDGVYVWPEGFAHYLQAHQVRPPPEFIRHVRHTAMLAVK
jgi:hypothetical protein